MTENSVAPAPDHEESAPRRCPLWCSGDGQAHNAGAHMGKGAELSVPKRHIGSTTPLLAAEILRLFEQQDASETPQVNWSAVGDLDLSEGELNSIITNIERFALQLRYVKRELTIARVAKPMPALDGPYVQEPPASRSATTMPCPSWCTSYGIAHDEQWLEDRDHYGPSPEIELSLENPGRDFLKNLMPATVSVSCKQRAFMDSPEIELELGTDRGAFCRISLGEARELHAILGGMINDAAAHARPGFLPPLDELLADAGAKVLEDPNLDCRSRGYGVSDREEPRRAWICLPQGLSPALREEYVRILLAELEHGPSDTLCENADPIRFVGDCHARKALTARVKAA
ncbi:DUF6907 domain-containing protein [Embleya sp. NPDC050493]|uniref:DUF6907 domain-containing protein n=1 Tax=Embleya sp. NPDC050493 TaxID=3363989 RepID=UPI00378EE018